MKRTFFDDKRDQHTADTSADPVDVVGRCIAHNCPNIWTHKESGLCRWHSASPPHMWPLVSEELRRMVTDLAIAKQNARPAPKLDHAEKTEILRKMRGLFATEPDDPRAWARKLKAREEGGERLSLAQRAMWRSALSHRDAA